MQRRSMLAIFGAPALVGILLLSLLGQWNNTPVNDSMPDNTPNPDSSSSPIDTTSQVDSDNEEMPISDNVVDDSEITEEIVNQETNEQDATTVVSETSGSSTVANSNDNPEIVSEQPSQDTTNTVTYSSGGGGGGHRHSSSSSESSSNEDNENDSETDNTPDLPPTDDSDEPQDGETIFVLPESPVGAIAMMGTALAALVAFMYVRTTRRTFSPI
jgi:hypothetical protein